MLSPLLTLLTALALASPLAGALGFASPLADVRIHAPSEEAAHALAREAMTVYARDGVEVHAYASADMVARLRARGFVVQVVATDYRAAIAPARAPSRATAYRTPEEINAALQALADAHPDLYVLERLGRSVEGVPILGLRVGGPGKPGVRILGGHHGDELPAIELVTDLLAELASRRATDPALAERLSRLHLLAAPLINPDGARIASRYNARNVDLNRNYNYQFRASEFGAGAYPFSEPETRAVASDAEYHRYASSLSFHTGAYNIGYPWNFTTAPLDAETAMHAYALRYQSLVPGSVFWVTRGSKWYITYGDTNDYSFGHYGAFDLTVEIGGEAKSPPPEQLAAIIGDQMQATIDWLGHVDETVVTRVVDAEDHTALAADVWSPIAKTTSDPIWGLAELQLSGPTTLTVAKPGWLSRTLEVTAGGDVVEIELVRQGQETALPVPNTFMSDAAIVFSLASDVASVIARRPGQEALLFDCTPSPSGVSCAAPAAWRRPGFYDLELTGDHGVTGVRNALLLEEAIGPAPPEFSVTAASGGFAISGAARATLVWLVAYGGASYAAKRGADGVFFAPVPEAVVPTWAAAIVEGGLQVLPLTLPEPRVAAPPAPRRRRGCGG